MACSHIHMNTILVAATTSQVGRRTLQTDSLITSSCTKLSDVTFWAFRRRCCDFCDDCVEHAVSPDLTHLMKCTRILRHGDWTVACCNGHIPSVVYTETTLHNPESSQTQNKLCSLTAPRCLTDRSCLRHCSKDDHSLLSRLWIEVLSGTVG